MKALNIMQLSKKYKNKIILDKLSLYLDEGQAYGLVGLNGIGKTTAIKIIVGLASQDEGEVLIFGDNKINYNTRAKIAYLPEKFSPSPFLTGEEFLEIALQYHNVEYNDQEAHLACQEMDFDVKDLKRQVGKYSKGMGQKLGLISVFMSKARLLILDEPMSGLDPRARIFLKRKLLDYKVQGNSIFFSSHILADVEEICDSIGVLHGGNLKYNGTVEQFIRQNKVHTLEEAYLKVIQPSTFN